LENRQFKFSPQIPYDLVAEPRTRANSVRDKLGEATSKTLQFSDWHWPKPFRSLGEGRLCILKIVRTHFALSQSKGEEAPARAWLRRVDNNFKFFFGGN